VLAAAVYRQTVHPYKPGVAQRFSKKAKFEAVVPAVHCGTENVNANKLLHNDLHCHTVANPDQVFVGGGQIGGTKTSLLV